MLSPALIRIACVSAVAALLAGCATTGGPGEKNVRQLEGTYQAPASSALPSDIKQILAAGGLDTTDPSAPTRGTEVAELATSRSRDVAKANGLARELGGAAAPMALAEASPAPAPLAAAAPTAPVVVASVPEPEPVTFVYPEIGAAAQAKPDEPVRVAEAAPARKRSRPAPAPPRAEAPKKPRRF